MLGIAPISEIAFLMGDPARAAMLYALKTDGQVSAGDLSAIAGVSASTASEHLSKLLLAGLVRATPQGQRRYYRLADPRIAEAIDCIESLAHRLNPPDQRIARQDEEMLHARACQDHLAGRIGGQLSNAMIAGKLVALQSDGPRLTPAGAEWLSALGADVDASLAGPRLQLGFCADWIEDAPHLGGAVGAAMLRGMIRSGWLRRQPKAMRVRVTPKGVAELRRQFGIDARPPGRY